MRAPDVWRIVCPGCGRGRVLLTDELTAVHDCFSCGLGSSAIAARGMPAKRDRCDWGKPLMREHYREELARCERAFGPRHLSVVLARAALAKNYGDYGEHEALSHYRAALALHPMSVPDHDVWLELAAGLGYQLKGSSETRLEARGCYELIHRQYARVLGESHLRLADCLRILADISRHLEDWRYAKACYERELAMWLEANGDAIAELRGRSAIPIIARTSYAFHPTHRDGPGDFRAHQVRVTRARLASMLVHLNEDPGGAVGVVTSAEAAAMGDFLAQTDKAFAEAAWFYDLADSLGPADEMERASVRAKAQMAKAMRFR
jgi:hypothetical protein